VTATLLHEPYIVPLGQRELTGSFRAAPDFRLRGMWPWTPFGLISVPEDHPGLRIEATIRGAPHLDVNSPDWTLQQVKGIHAARCRNLRIRNTVIEDVPTEAILASGIQGLDISHTHARRVLCLLTVHYFNGPSPRRNQDVYVHGYCTGADLRLPKAKPVSTSVLDSRFSVAGAAIYLAACEDAEVVDFASVGEVGGTVKTVDGRRVRIARCIGSNIMVQGSCYWSPELGPHSIYQGAQLPWPLGPGSRAEDITVEECNLHPRLSLTPLYDHPEYGGNTIQVSYPQRRTTIRNNHLWWEQGSYPTLHSAIQLAEGAEVTLTGNIFHRATAESHHAVWNAPGNLPAANGFHGDSAHDRWPSQILNADWRTANQFSAFKIESLP